MSHVPPIEQKIPILPLGTIMNVDERGYLINESSIEKIVPSWGQVVTDVVESLRFHLGDTLHSIRIRGSVAKGIAIEGISDIDCIVIVNVDPKSIDVSWMSRMKSDILSKYPFVKGIEADLTLVDVLRNPLNMLYPKNWTTC